jgi:hypothetical protein
MLGNNACAPSLTRYSQISNRRIAGSPDTMDRIARTLDPLVNCWSSTMITEAYIQDPKAVFSESARSRMCEPVLPSYRTPNCLSVPEKVCGCAGWCLHRQHHHSPVGKTKQVTHPRAHERERYVRCAKTVIARLLPLGLQS